METPPTHTSASARIPHLPVGDAPQGALIVDLRRIIYALADALDLVGIDDVGHGKRVGIMAAQCALFLDVDEDARVFLFELGLLHDIGVSRTTTHNHLVTEFDWPDSQSHCLIGCQRVENYSPLAAMAEPIRYHHTHWSYLQTLTHVSDLVKLQANLIFLVDRVDALAAPHYADGSLLEHTARIRSQIQECAGSFFSPELVEAFLTASATEAFWLQLEPRGIHAFLQDMLSEHHASAVGMSDLLQLAHIFSRIVDAKSPFTAEHSLGVALLARYLGEHMGLDESTCAKLEIAGLLHDLGKLRVPDNILDKPGQLSERERKTINAHSFETFQILRNIPGFEEITRWAAYHHEKPDGSGYPFHLSAEELSIEARIMRVADIFQAMVQNRPYRKGLSAVEAVDFLRVLAAQGEIDSNLLHAFSGDLTQVMAAALPANTAHQ